MFVFIDPQMSFMTDDVIEGKTSEPHFRRAVVWLSRLVGTVLTQLLLILAAMLIVLRKLCDGRSSSFGLLKRRSWCLQKFHFLRGRESP
jgi:hypothetical protein